MSCLKPNATAISLRDRVPDPCDVLVFVAREGLFPLTSSFLITIFLASTHGRRSSWRYAPACAACKIQHHRLRQHCRRRTRQGLLSRHPWSHSACRRAALRAGL
ncbi:hypothetical protein SBA5_160041 [Candidatus Sulfotelmatomonas gaucii]|uniref:Uncharacterized protein n=1 Tax=Candidatus Sulfuritelmatomonas gaucii TaxID=2043161 RepID=A0A2N9L5G8_9BACT|nr:hypothetical protein SBA5_160041 [Candidatus Sulfotelmatomonas gaucii]